MKESWRNWLILAAIVIAIGPVAWGVGQSPKPVSGVLSDLRKGVYVGLTDCGASYEIVMYPAIGAPGAYEVVEVASDYVVLRDMANVDAKKIPIYSIKSTTALRAMPTNPVPGPGLNPRPYVPPSMR